MKENTTLGRRRFLRSTAVGVVGIAGGMAATGTVRAAKSFVVDCKYGAWDYSIYVSDSIKKGQKAGYDDSIDSDGDRAMGSVHGNGVDDFEFDGFVTGVEVSSADGSGAAYFYIDHNSSDGFLKVMGDDGPVDYVVKTFGGISKYAQADDADEIRGDDVHGNINPGGVDNYAVDRANEIKVTHPGNDSGVTFSWVIRIS